MPFRLSRLPTANVIVQLALHPGVMVALCSFLLGTLWAFRIPPLDAPDEIAHLQTIMEVRKGHLLPEIHYDFTNGEGSRAIPIGSPGDQSVRDYARQRGFTDAYRLVPYEAIQPPLYYLAAGLVALVVPPDPEAVLRLSRLLSVLFGAATVYFCWASIRQHFLAAPIHFAHAQRGPMLAVAVAGLIALLPQFCFNSATAANDAALNLGVAASFYLWLRALREPAYDPWMFRSGLVLGLALLVKLTAVALVPGLALVVLFRAFQVGAGPSVWKAWLSRAARMYAGAFAVVAVVCGWWFVRNLIVYGEPSGSRDALRFYMGRAPLFNPATPGSLNRFAGLTFQSTLGRFGWMTTPLPPEYYTQAAIIGAVLLALTLLALALGAARWVAHRKGLPTYVWQAAAAMLAVAAAVIVVYIQFNLTIARQPQGRYLFPLLLPGALALTGGVYFLPFRPMLKAAAFGVLLAWLALVNFASLFLITSIQQ